MKAARIVGPKRFEVLDVPAPEPKPGEVLVKFNELSICGSDLLTYDRVFPEEDYPRPAGFPCHECAGYIEESYADGFRPGQYVISLAYSGGLFEYSSVPSSLVIPIPEGVDPSMAVLCQPAGTVIFALQKVGPVFGKRVVVLGQGPIGLIFTELLVKAGASQVIVTDVIDHRLDVAKTRGADDVINPTKVDTLEAVTELTKGQLADLVIDASGVTETVNDSIRVVRKEGTINIFGMPHVEESVPFDWFNMYNKLPNIIVTNSRRSNDVVPSVQAAVDLMARGRLDLKYMVTNRYPFDEVEEAFRAFAERKNNTLKILIDV
jgi:2-desacetyl-2-hydroxyethyl bacteriochlorophyllide A dehydrogenase